MKANNNLQGKRIGVLMGGTSTERSISLKSGNAVCKALKGDKCNAVALDLKTTETRKITSMLRDANLSVVFIALHGPFGEDGSIQNILDKLKIPYTGSGATASRLSMDKITSRRIFKRHNIPVPKSVTINRKKIYDPRSISTRLGGFPLVVKPTNQGSSIGTSVVKNLFDLNKGIARAFKFSNEIIVEQYISGRELTVGVLEDKPLPIVEIVPKEEFFNFKAKYKPGKTEYILNVKLPSKVYKRVQRAGLRAHKAIKCRDFSRVDLILDVKNRPVVLEVNSIPGLTATSLLPKAALVRNIEFPELCLKLITLALCRRRKKG